MPVLALPLLFAGLGAGSTILAQQAQNKAAAANAIQFINKNVDERTQRNDALQRELSLRQTVGAEAGQTGSPTLAEDTGQSVGDAAVDVGLLDADLRATLEALGAGQDKQTLEVAVAAGAGLISGFVANANLGIEAGKAAAATEAAAATAAKAAGAGSALAASAGGAGPAGALTSALATSETLRRLLSQ